MLFLYHGVTRYLLRELFRLLHLTGAPHHYVRLAAGAGADLAWWWWNGMVRLSSHVARQIFMSCQMPLALLAAGQS